jgi:hypothetical protein
MVTTPTAGTITVSQTLDLLDGPYSQLAEGLANQGRFGLVQVFRALVSIIYLR